jgi:hypothetical protein
MTNRKRPMRSIFPHPLPITATTTTTTTNNNNNNSVMCLMTGP